MESWSQASADCEVVAVTGSRWRCIKSSSGNCLIMLRGVNNVGRNLVVPSSRSSLERRIRVVTHWLSVLFSKDMQGKLQGCMYISISYRGSKALMHKVQGLLAGLLTPPSLSLAFDVAWSSSLGGFKKLLWECKCGGGVSFSYVTASGQGWHLSHTLCEEWRRKVLFIAIIAMSVLHVPALHPDPLRTESKHVDE